MKDFLYLLLLAFVLMLGIFVGYKGLDFILSPFAPRIIFSWQTGLFAVVVYLMFSAVYLPENMYGRVFVYATWLAAFTAVLLHYIF